jgi:glycosyltransferase involved in cell wall biosynthesis
MRIAYVSANEVSSWGGSEELWFQSARRLRQEGFDIFVNVKKWDEVPEPIHELSTIGCHVTRRDVKVSTASLLQRLHRKLNSVITRKPSKFFLPFYQWLLKSSPTLVILSLEMNTSGFSLMKACLDLKIPYVLLIHCAGEPFWPGDKAAQNLIIGYKNALKCFFVSEGNLKLTEKQLAYTFTNAAIVRNPFKVSYTDILSWPDEKVYCLACVGRLDLFAKGQDMLLEVFKQDKWKVRNIQITLYGDGKQRNTLERLKEMWSIPNVIVGGFEKDIKNIWRQNHALIMPSRFEGLPLAIVEAMLCQRMCIVTDVAGNAELLEDNVTGFIVAAPKATLLDEALERAWQRRSEWKQMGEKAAQQVKTFVPEDPIREFNKLILQQTQ